MLQVKKNVVGDLRNQMMKQQVEMVMAIQSHLNPSNPISTLAPSDDVQVFQKGSQDSNSSQHSENGKVTPAVALENLNNGRNSQNPTMDRNCQNGSDQNGRRDSDQNARNGRESDGRGRGGNKVSKLFSKSDGCCHNLHLLF